MNGGSALRAMGEVPATSEEWELVVVVVVVRKWVLRSACNDGGSRRIVDYGIEARKYSEGVRKGSEGEDVSQRLQVSCTG